MSQFTCEDREVLTERYDEHTYVVTIRGRPGEALVLSGPGWHHTFLMDLHSREQVPWRDGAAAVTVAADGRAWLMVFAPPPEVSAFDYRPRALLEVPGQDVARARFPVVDVHAHLLVDGGVGDDRRSLMDALNIRAVVTSAFADRGECTATTRARFGEDWSGRVLPAATVDWRAARRPNGARQLAEQLACDVQAHGVVLVGEMHEKGFGVDDHGVGPVTADPMYIDDERLDDVWDACAELELPVLVHCGDDLAKYQPWDATNEQLRALYRRPWQRRRPGGLSHAEVHERRDRVLQRFPRLQMIAAHLDSESERLSVLAERLRRLPNLHLELGVRHRTLARQPRTARRFLEEHADRVLFGGDRILSRAAYLEAFRVLETEDDAFGETHDGPGPCYGLGLSAAALEHLYHLNAVRLLPRARLGETVTAAA